MNVLIEKLHIGQVIKLNLLQEPIKYELHKENGIIKHVPLRELVDCTVKWINITSDKIDYIRNDRPTFTFKGYTLTEQDTLFVEDKKETSPVKIEVPVIKTSEPETKAKKGKPGRKPKK